VFIPPVPLIAVLPTGEVNITTEKVALTAVAVSDVEGAGTAEMARPREDVDVCHRKAVEPKP
jgi:hypothetical protein